MRRGVRRESGSLLKSRKGALTHHRPEAGGGSPCGARALSEGDCDLCGDRQPMSPCLRARRASAARLTHISHADSDQHGKYATGMILMPVNRVCKPATGSFAGVRMPAGIPSLLFFEREAEKRLCGAGKEERIWRFTITPSRSPAAVQESLPAHHPRISAALCS